MRGVISCLFLALLSATTAYSQGKIHKIDKTSIGPGFIGTVDNQPGTITHDGTNPYVLNWGVGSGNIQKMNNDAPLTILEFDDVGLQPNDIVIEGNEIWVISGDGNFYYISDKTSTNWQVTSPVTPQSISSAVYPKSFIKDASNHFILDWNSGNGFIRKRDVSNPAFPGSNLQLGGGSGIPVKILMDPNSNNLLIINRDNTFHFVDKTTFLPNPNPGTTISGLVEPVDFILDQSDNTQIWIADWNDGNGQLAKREILNINVPSTLVSVGGYPNAIVQDPGNNNILYVANGNGYIQKVDITVAPPNHIEQAYLGGNLADVVLDVSGDYLWVTSSGPKIATTNPLTVCGGGTMTFNATEGLTPFAASSWDIEFDPAGPSVPAPSVSGANNEQATFDLSGLTAGQYTFYIEVEDNHGNEPALGRHKFDITINEPMSADGTTANPISSCQDGSTLTNISVTGTIGGGTLGTGSSAQQGHWVVTTGGGTIASSGTATGSPIVGTSITDSYIPVAADIGTTVTLQLVAEDPDAAGPCGQVTDNLDIALNGVVTSSPGTDITVCMDGGSGGDIPLSGTIGGGEGGSLSGHWEVVTGFGSGSVTGSSQSGPGPITDTYIASASDVGTQVRVRLVAEDPDGGGGCSAIDSELNININEQVTVSITTLDPTVLCSLNPVAISGTISGGTLGSSGTAIQNGQWNKGSGLGSVGGSTQAGVIDDTYTPDSNDNGTILTVQLAAEDPDGGGPCAAATAEIDIHYQEICRTDPVDMVLVLDYSGSMGNYANPSDPSQGSKRDKLVDAVTLFTDAWKINFASNDRAEIVIFRSNVDPTNVTLELLDVESLQSELTPGPGGATAMGGGIQVALTGLNSYPGGTNHPTVVVFTDGIQNRNPMLQDLGNMDADPESEFQISSTGGYGDSGIPGAPGTYLETYNIPISVVAISQGFSISYHDLLDDVTQKTGGVFLATNDPVNELNSYFLNTLQAALDFNTLEIVDFRNGTVNSGQTLIESFSMDNGVVRATFGLYWPGEQAPQDFDNFKIKGPGNQELVPTYWVKRDRYSLAVINFPYNHGGTDIYANGQWQIYTENPVTANSNYQAFLLVDETVVHYDVSTPSEAEWAGEPLLIKAVITEENDDPLTHVDAITAEIQKPGIALGDFIARSRLKMIPVDNSDDAQPRASLKYNEMIKNVDILKKIQQRKFTVKLNDQGIEGDEKAGDGIYSYQLKNTREPGLYHFDVSMSGKTRNGEPVQRTTSFSHMLKLRPDINRTKCKFKKTSDDGLAGSIFLTPIANSKYCLGPGFEQHIRLEFSGKVKYEIIDHLNGQYEIKVRSEEPLSNYDVTMRVYGQLMYRGPVTRIGKLSRKERKEYFRIK